MDFVVFKQNVKAKFEQFSLDLKLGIEKQLEIYRTEIDTIINDAEKNLKQLEECGVKSEQYSAFLKFHANEIDEIHTIGLSAVLHTLSDLHINKQENLVEFAQGIEESNQVIVDTNLDFTIPWEEPPFTKLFHLEKPDPEAHPSLDFIEFLVKETIGIDQKSIHIIWKGFNTIKSFIVAKKIINDKSIYSGFLNIFTCGLWENYQHPDLQLFILHDDAEFLMNEFLPIVINEVMSKKKYLLDQEYCIETQSRTKFRITLIKAQWKRANQIISGLRLVFLDYERTFDRANFTFLETCQFTRCLF